MNETEENTEAKWTGRKTRWNIHGKEKEGIAAVYIRFTMRGRGERKAGVV